MKKNKVLTALLATVLLTGVLGGCSPAAQPPADPPSGTAAADVWQVSEYEAMLTLQPPQGTEADVTAYTYADGAFYIAVTYLEPMAQFGQKLEIHRYDLTAKTDEVIYERQGNGLWGNELCTNGEKVAFAEYCEGEYAVKVYDIAGKSWGIAIQGLAFNPVLTIGQTHLFWYRSTERQAALCTSRLSDGQYGEEMLKEAPYAYGRVAVHADQVVYPSGDDVLTVGNMTDGSTKDYRLGEQTTVFDLDYDGESILWSTAEKPREFHLISCADQGSIALSMPKEHQGKSFFKAYLVDGPWVAINTKQHIFMWNTEQNTFTLLHEAEDSFSLAQRVGERVFFQQTVQDGKIRFLCLEKK